MAARVRSPLPDPRSSTWQRDLAAGILFVAGLLAAVSLFSHHPADPPAPSILPVNARPLNLLGEGGASVAHSLFSALGLAAHVLLAAWFVLVILLLLRQHLFTWSRRLAGWLLLVPLAAILADRFLLGLDADVLGWTPLAGPGGSIGAWLSLSLAESLPLPTQALLLFAISFLVLILIADRLLWKGVRAAWNGSRLLFRKEAAPSRRVPLRRLEIEEAEDVVGEATECEPVAVPHEGQHASEPARTIPIRHHDRVESRKAPPPPVDDFSDFVLPALTLLDDAEAVKDPGGDQLLRERATLLEKTFGDFGLKVQVVGINTGPVITQYEIALDVGLRVNKVTRLAEDLALNLKVPHVRIVAPIPGKNTVGVEIPNESRALVRLKEVILAAGKKSASQKIPLFLGKDAEGRPLVQDLADMPHLMIAGSTGTGKSVCMNALILSMLMTRRPDEVKLIMIDPKRVEMSAYGKLPHMLHPVVEDMKKAEAILAWAVDKMEERYDLLRQARVRNITGYNQLTPDEVKKRIHPADEDERARIPDRMPYIVIIIDEVADLILQYRKEVEGHIIRLAQKSRAAGIHLVLATQKPTVDVITSLIKSNMPSRVCFKVVNKTDSRVVLDQMGADKLLGKGDMLFLPPGTSDLVRSQCTYASDQEINRIVSALETDEPCYAEELLHLPVNRGNGDLTDALKERDELYEQAVEIVIREQRGSVSLLQRTLGIGYGRAARLVDFMAEDGIVGSYQGSNAREVSYTLEQWEEMKAAARS